MAGLGFKDFQVGEVLTSSDVDGYLMQQAVMRFADDGARGSAIGTAPGTAVALSEGFVTYLDSTKIVQVYDGTTWKEVGYQQNVTTQGALHTVAITANVWATVGTVTADCDYAFVDTTLIPNGSAKTVYASTSAGNTGLFVGSQSSNQFANSVANFSGAILPPSTVVSALSNDNGDATIRIKPVLAAGKRDALYGEWLRLLSGSSSGAAATTHTVATTSSDAVNAVVQLDVNIDGVSRTGEVFVGGTSDGNLVAKWITASAFGNQLVRVSFVVGPSTTISVEGTGATTRWRYAIREYSG